MEAIYTNKDVKIAGLDASAFYWTSTQTSSSNAYVMDMSTGTMTTYDKNSYKFHVRCVRQ